MDRVACIQRFYRAGAYTVDGNRSVRGNRMQLTEQAELAQRLLEDDEQVLDEILNLCGPMVLSCAPAALSFLFLAEFTWPDVQ